MNQNCRIYALPSLCFSILPECRTPEITNNEYFANLRAHEMKQRQPKKNNKRKRIHSDSTKAKMRPSSTTTATTSTSLNFLETIQSTTPFTVYFTGDATPVVDAFSGKIMNKASDELMRRRRKRQDNPRPVTKSFPPTRNTENLRRICKNECELLENELCQKEYAIAKRHPAIGQKLALEDCFDLPNERTDCLTLGITLDVQPDDSCYWENGISYRGTVAHSISGRKCLKWAQLMKELADYPELAGQNYCR